MSQQLVKRRRGNLDDIPKGPSRLSSFAAGNNNRLSGFINHMVLKNFMCHSHLEVDFTNNINYIIGKNGSGKSAILTALVVGLGGKANLTNRGNSIKGFVKAGRNSASIQITLYNNGINAFEHDLYGNTITIIRTFSQSGSSTYKIKNHSQETVSTQSKEIARITAAFHIQIDNPLCILNQDTSRNFLTSADPKMKYQLFMRGTRLESYKETVKSILNHKQTSHQGIQDNLKLLEGKKAEYAELQQKLLQLQSLAGMKEKLDKTNVELLWSQVVDIESELSEKTKDSSEKVEKYAKLVDITQNRNLRLEEAQININALQKQIAELREETLAQTQPQIDCKSQIDALNKQLASIQRDKQSVLRSRDSKEADFKICELNIKENTEKLSKVEMEKLERINKKVDFEKKLMEIDNILQTTENEQFQSEENLGRKEEELKMLQIEHRQLSKEKVGIEERIRGIVENQGNQLAVYGGYMPRLLQLLQSNCKRFHKLPIGPIGHYITVKENKWTLAIEGHISGNLRAFLVDNAQDCCTFREIFKSNFPTVQEPSIITGKFRDTIPNEINLFKVAAPSDCVAIIDAIIVSSNPVFNILLDHNNIESTLLIPSGDRAMELLSNVNTVPRKCRLGLTIAGDKFYPDPNYRSYASTYKQVRYLQVATSEILCDLKIRLTHVQEREVCVSESSASAQSAVCDCRKNLAHLREYVDKLRANQLKLKRLIDDLINKVQPDTTNIQAMQIELQEIKHDLDRLQSKLNNLEGDIKNTQVQIADKINLLKQLKLNTVGIEDRILPLKQDLEEQNSKKQELLVSASFDKRRLNSCKDILHASQKEQADKQEELDKMTAQANSLGGRPPEIRNVQTLIDSINHLQHHIAVAECECEHPDAVAERTRACKERLDDITRLITLLRTDYVLLQSLYRERKMRYERVLDYFVSLLKFSFEQILETRQFRGDISIDLDEQTLDIVVLPRHGINSQTSTANLSGGERSYSTVAFLYSLWQCLNFPFYLLDEFDVFMDKANRTAIMSILIEHAKGNPQAQFVFLTPQDVSFINDPAVAIHRLDDPERKSLTQ